MQPGEYLPLIAEQAGFLTMTVWNLRENEKLRRARRNPCVLAPGDVVYIPERRQKTVQAATGRRHTFSVKRDALALRFAVFDFDNKPFEGVAAELTIEGDPLALTTDGRGVIEREIVGRPRNGALRIPSLGIDVVIAIGQLPPAAEESGWRARLINLGYYRGAVDDSGEAATKLWRWALEEFQCDFGLKVSGTADAATVAKLESVHGS